MISLTIIFFRLSLILAVSLFILACGLSSVVAFRLTVPVLLLCFYAVSVLLLLICSDRGLLILAGQKLLIKEGPFVLVELQEQ
jgi:hypothetical protein